MEGRLKEDRYGSTGKGDDSTGKGIERRHGIKEDMAQLARGMKKEDMEQLAQQLTTNMELEVSTYLQGRHHEEKLAVSS